MPERFICDVRGGAVAVYRGPKETCFLNLPATLYYGRGVRIEKTEYVGWYMPLQRVWWAHVVCFCANAWEWLGFTVKEVDHELRSQSALHLV